MNKLLQRSDELEASLKVAQNAGSYTLLDTTSKLLLCTNACQLSLEHARSVRILFTSDAPHSATGLLRLQYEALLRAVWILYAANDLQLTRLATELDPQSEHAANNLPGQTHRFGRYAHGQWRLLLAEITDRNDNRIQLNYPPSNFGAGFDPFATQPRPSHIVDSAGRVLLLSWTQHGQLSTVHAQTSTDASQATLMVQYRSQQTLQICKTTWRHPTW
jgi:hypothetical protein